MTDKEPSGSGNIPAQPDKLENQLPVIEKKPIDVLSQRIADPQTSPHEAVLFTLIRRELIEQDQAILDREHARAGEIRSFWARLAFSGAAVAAGGALIGSGLPLEGFVILGIGLHWLAPDFVKTIYDRILGRGGKQDGE